MDEISFWLLPIGLVLISYLVILKDLPSPTKLGNYDVPVATKVYDRNGHLLYDIFADQNRSPIPLTHIPKYLQQATIAIEDKDFYRHGGISPVGGMVRAIVASVTKNKLQGGQPSPNNSSNPRFSPRSARSRAKLRK